MKSLGRLVPRFADAPGEGTTQPVSRISIKRLLHGRSPCRILGKAQPVDAFAEMIRGHGFGTLQVLLSLITRLGEGASTG